MEVICYQIRIKPGMEDMVDHWADRMKQSAEEVTSSLKKETVLEETVFKGRDEKGLFLIYLVRAKSLETMRHVSTESKLAIETFHKNFKQEAFGEKLELVKLIDFHLLNNY